LADPHVFPHKRTTWRFIDDGEHSGAHNMARDEAIALSTGAGSPPTLRVYKFLPAAVSIGRFQPVRGLIDAKTCARENIEIVRRPTGGLAILHLDDFTYSVSLPRQAGAHDARDKYFALISIGILEALVQLGIRGRVVSHTGTGIKTSAWCFDGTFGVDIEWRGRKVCGSAQRLFKEAVLQHGSVFLRVNPELLEKITVTGHEVAKVVQLKNAFVSLPEAAGRTVTWEQVSRAFQEGFSSSLSIEVEPGTLSKSEELLAERIYATKYANDGWLLGTGP
jgi:lipoate-protein ligase A